MDSQASSTKRPEVRHFLTNVGKCASMTCSLSCTWTLSYASRDLPEAASQAEQTLETPEQPFHLCETSITIHVQENDADDRASSPQTGRDVKTSTRSWRRSRHHREEDVAKWALRLEDIHVGPGREYAKEIQRCW
mmetsp:Transcript_19505/g.60225  ORF Transcript_19505/g.60225 Transcript_19505/m.60225 type:complete len:135 (+) Transcript_19505:1180-1584(+)